MTGRFSGCHLYHCNLEYLRYHRRRTNEHYFPPGGLGIATNENHPIKSVLSTFYYENDESFRIDRKNQITATYSAGG